VLKTVLLCHRRNRRSAAGFQESRGQCAGGQSANCQLLRTGQCAQRQDCRRMVAHSENGRDGCLARAIRHSCREVQIPFAQATGHELHVRALCLGRVELAPRCAFVCGKHCQPPPSGPGWDHCSDSLSPSSRTYCEYREGLSSDPDGTRTKCLKKPNRSMYYSRHCMPN